MCAAGRLIASRAGLVYTACRANRARVADAPHLPDDWPEPGLTIHENAHARRAAGQPAGLDRRAFLARSLGVGASFAGVAATALWSDPDAAAGRLLSERASESRPPVFRPEPGRYFLTSDEIAAVKRNIFTHRYPWAVRAWANTRQRAKTALQATPQPTDPNADLTDWNTTIYTPGEIDGNHAHNLAVAYAITGELRHGRKAGDFCLAWARRYWPLPAPSRIGHMIAESGGPVVKLCMAYDLVKPTLSDPDRQDFRRWAAAFIPRAQANVDSSRDHPWVADVDYGGDVSNPAPYGNSATWQRLMAVWASAVVGGDALRSTLQWNWQHTTSDGRDYGWNNLLEGLIIDGSGGEVVEGRYRSSIEYGHFSWCPLAYIADVAKHAGFEHDLFRYRSRPHGYSILTPVRFYARYLRSRTVPGDLERTKYGGSSWPSSASRWRAFYELLYRNSAHDPRINRLLAGVLAYGGPTQRGDNYDVYLSNYNAVVGRSPREPLA